MRIGFDGKRALQNFTGLGNYSRFVINTLAKYRQDNEYFLYASADKKKGDFPGVRFRQPISDKKSWRSFGIVKDLKRDKIDVYHGLSNEIPFGIKRSGLKSVVTIHDLIFLRYPEFYPFFDRVIYKFKSKYACKNANKIIASSEQTKRDIINYFKTPEDKIEVVYQDCDRQFKPEAGFPNENIIRRKYNLPEKFILNVGTIEKRKNLIVILKALVDVPREISLVVVGKKTDYFAEAEAVIRQNQLQNRVIFLDKVEFSDLPSIYRMAKVFIYPSRFEGFGIPIIEALNCEVPVIAATGSCLEEAGGKAALYISPDDDKQLAFFINQILDDPQKADEMIKLGLEHVRKFDERLLADQLTNIYIHA